MDSSPTLLFTKLWPGQLRRLRCDLRASRFTADPRLVSLALSHYDSFYAARRASTVSNPVESFAAPWATSLERASHWVAGTRPNVIIHLVYSELSLRFESQLEDLLLGVHSGDLGDICHDQLNQINEIQRRTIEKEVEIGREFDEVQERMAAMLMPGVDSKLEDKVCGLSDVMMRADELRMTTLRDVLEILSPRQAVDMLVALIDFELGMREIGMEHEHEMSRGKCNSK